MQKVFFSHHLVDHKRVRKNTNILLLINEYKKKLYDSHKKRLYQVGNSIDSGIVSGILRHIYLKRNDVSACSSITDASTAKKRKVELATCNTFLQAG